MLRIMRGALMQYVEIASFFTAYLLNLFKVLTRHGFYRIDQELKPILYNLNQIIPADKTCVSSSSRFRVMSLCRIPFMTRS